MLVDGIPFNDTNSPTHHSWEFFPSQFIRSDELAWATAKPISAASRTASTPCWWMEFRSTTPIAPPTTHGSFSPASSSDLMNWPGRQQNLFPRLRGRPVHHVGGWNSVQRHQ